MRARTGLFPVTGFAPFRGILPLVRSIITCVLFALAPALPAAAQVFLGAEAGPDAFLKSEDTQPDLTGDDAFSWAFSAELSSASLYAVFESTSPEREIFKYMREGIYRQELAAIFLMSERLFIPFKKLAAELPKAGGFRGLAKKHKADAMALFEEGGRLKEAADLHLPLFLSVSSASAGAYGTTWPVIPARQ